MKLTPLVHLGIWIFTSLLFTTNLAFAAIVAADNASDPAYADAWQSGDNGGSGFGPWTLSTNNNDPSTGGQFIGNSSTNGNGSSGNINTGTPARSFGLYANNNDASFATRSFTGGALLPGQAFNLAMDNGFIDSGSVGFVLLDALGNASVGFRFQGGDTFYEVVVSTGAVSTTVPFTADGLNVSILLGAADSFTLSINSNVEYAGTLVATAPTQFQIINSHAGSNADHDAFFNNFSVTPEPTSLSLLALGCVTLLRRRRRGV